MDHDPRASRTPARRVRRLHLRARSRALVQRGALLVEDALRTATVPAGVLVVRRLDLGRIDPRRAPAAVSVRIEESLRHARARARPVTAGDVIAADRGDRRDGGDAVLFADEVAPCALLALALARGQRPDAWYWPRVVPGYAAALPAARQLAAVLEAAARTRPGAVAVARVLDMVMRQAGARAAGSFSLPGSLPGSLLGALEPAVVRRLMAAAPAAGWAAASGMMLDARPDRSALPAAHADARAAGTHAATPALDVLPAAWREPVRALVARWPAGDARALWLVAMGLVQARPHAARDPELPARAAALAGALVAHALRTPERAVSSSAPPGDAGRSRPTGAHGAESRPPVHPARAEATDEAATPDADRDAGAGDARSGAEPAIGATAATDAGGFLFLIRVLQHCRMDAWLAEHERSTAIMAWDVPRLVLLRIADLLDIPASDPARLCLLDEDEAAQMTAAGAGVAAETVTATEEDAAVDTWIARVSDWLAAAPGALTLADVVRRPARMAWTRTHVDVFLRAQDADLRIRRLGLDLDPGWVPWLARVVTFHYLAAEEYHDL